MSTCPTKDIHSLYLDNEMPEIYKTEYESHVQNCPKCRERLQKLKDLRSLLHSEADEEISSKVLDSSFERLQLKMKYSKNVGRAENNKFTASKYFYIPVAAAAAVFAFMFTFTSLNKKTGQVIDSSTVASAVKSSDSVQNVALGSGRSVVISGNIHESFIRNSRAKNNGFIQNVSSNSTERNFIQDVDIFRPSFANEKTKSIKITVPDMNSLPVTVEIQLPDVPVEQVFTSEFNQ